MPSKKEIAKTNKQINKIYQAYKQSRPSFVAKYKKEQVIDMITNFMLTEKFKQMKEELY